MSLIFNNGISCLTCNQNGKKAVIPYTTVPRLRVSSLYLVHIKMEAKTQTRLKIKCSTKMRFLNGLKSSFIWSLTCADRIQQHLNFAVVYKSFSITQKRDQKTRALKTNLSAIYFQQLIVYSPQAKKGFICLNAFFFFFLRATPTVYGGTQDRGRIGAAAAGTHHSHCHMGSQPLHTCNLHHSSLQHQVLNPQNSPGIKPASSWILVQFITD